MQAGSWMALVGTVCPGWCLPGLWSAASLPTHANVSSTDLCRVPSVHQALCGVLGRHRSWAGPQRSCSSGEMTDM